MNINFKSRFNLFDEVYFLYQDRILKGVITGCEIKIGNIIDWMLANKNEIVLKEISRIEQEKNYSNTYWIITYMEDGIYHYLHIQNDNVFKDKDDLMKLLEGRLKVLDKQNKIKTE